MKRRLELTKPKIRSLTLHKDTMRVFQDVKLRGIVGGEPPDDSFVDTCPICDTSTLSVPDPGEL